MKGRKEVKLTDFSESEYESSEITGEITLTADALALIQESIRMQFEDPSSYSSTDAVETFIVRYNATLQEIAEERTNVLVVDELDRCIPQYAIKVLERLHHIFYGLTNVVVVIAMDRNQLEHSVEEMFIFIRNVTFIRIEELVTMCTGIGRTYNVCVTKSGCSLLEESLRGSAVT